MFSCCVAVSLHIACSTTGSLYQIVEYYNYYCNLQHNHVALVLVNTPTALPPHCQVQGSGVHQPHYCLLGLGDIK